MTSTPRIVLGSLVALVMLGVLIGLGVWQVQRLALKNEFQRQQDFVYNAQPIELPVLANNLQGLSFRRVRVTGRFDHAAELYLWAQRDGVAGYDVLTPFERVGEGESQWIIVDRGWVPLDRKDPATRQPGQIDGAATVTGFVRTDMTERGKLTPANEPAKNLWYTVDYAAMGDATKHYVRPFVVVADATPVPGGLPAGAKGVPVATNNHLQYAITWFSLAGVLVVMYLLALRRQLAARAKS